MWLILNMKRNITDFLIPCLDSGGIAPHNEEAKHIIFDFRSFSEECYELKNDGVFQLLRIP